MSKDNSDQKTKISLKPSTVTVLLGSAKNELEHLKQNPDVARALLLQDTLRKMSPEEEKLQSKPRENNRGKDHNSPRANRERAEVNEDRKKILAFVKENTPITISELVELRYPDADVNSDSTEYKYVYNDVWNLHKQEKINKANKIVTYKEEAEA